MRTSLLLLVGLALSLTNLSGEGQPASSFGFRLGLGLPQVGNNHLEGTLSALGQIAPNPSSLVTYGGGYSLGVGGLVTDVVSTRTSNGVFGSQTGDPRTRFVLDETDLTVGTQWEALPGLSLSGGVGVGVSKLLLQTYTSSASTLKTALATPGQVSLVSSWNWSPVASARLAWRFLKVPGTTTGLTLGAGISAAGYPFAVQWKVADDVAVSGIGAPWDLTWTPSVWLGFE